MKTDITDPVGLRTYSPTEEACRKAPALVCNVASRVVRLRKKLADLHDDNPAMAMNLAQLERFLLEFTSVLPFEKELLSGDIEQVNSAFERTDISDLSPDLIIRECDCPQFTSRIGVTIDSQNLDELRYSNCPYCKNPFRKVFSSPTGN